MPRPGGTISLAAGAVVQGNTFPAHAELVANHAELIAGPLAGTVNVSINADGTQSLEPGRYGNVAVGPRAILDLSAGEYAFRTLTVSSDARIRIDDSRGAVGVFVHDQINYDGSVQAVGGEHPQWILVFTGTSDVNLNSAFQGALFAPGAKVILGTADPSSNHAGQFLARSIEVHQHQTVLFRPFEAWDNLWAESNEPSQGLPGDGLEAILPQGPVGTAIGQFIFQAFENANPVEYEAAKAVLRALPTQDVVAGINQAFAEAWAADLAYLIIFTAGVTPDEQLLPLYQSIIDMPVPGFLLTSHDAHEERGVAHYMVISQALTNLVLTYKAGVQDALLPLFDAVHHPVEAVRLAAVFRIKQLAEETDNTQLLDDLEDAILAGDEDLLNVRRGTNDDLVLVPDEDELIVEGPLPPAPLSPTPGPSSGGMLPDCSSGTQDGAETDVDCGGPCEPCVVGDACVVDHDCSTASCQAGVCAPANPGDGDGDSGDGDGDGDSGDGDSGDGDGDTGGNCIDLGADGHNVTVPANACVRVFDAYPEWWNTRPMQLQVFSASQYPVPFQWTSTCSGGSGAGQFQSAWQNQILSPTSENCETRIELSGASGQTITLRYYGN